MPRTAVAMLVFAREGSIDWSLGAALGAGSVLGGLLGSRRSFPIRHVAGSSGCSW
ncbi:MAG: hypothetical protein AB7O95_18900 [Geminicoccaceae bacterium]